MIKDMATARKRGTIKNPKRPRPLTVEEKEDARDVALIRKTISKGGRTYSHSQILKKYGLTHLL